MDPYRPKPIRLGPSSFQGKIPTSLIPKNLRRPKLNFYRSFVGKMEVARRYLSVPEEESEKVSRIVVPPRKAGDYPSFYENFSLRGLQIQRAEPGLIVSTFKVPPRLTDRSGNLATGAIANLVDEIGYAVVYVEGTPMSVSVNMSISYLAPAKAHDELEITSKALGQRGRYSGTLVVLRNKQSGEVVAEGRHSLFSAHASKI